MEEHRLRLSTLVFTLFVIIVLSYSAQPLALKHWPKFLGKFAATARTHSEPPPQFRYETRCIQQSLDHFSFSELPTFPQRYLISTEHWVGPRPLGPVFFYSGNEDDIEWFAQNTGVVWEIAPRFGAMVVFPEHQYYGESVPYGSAEEAYKNVTTLSYLTSEQALADFSVLIADLKHNFSTKDCPVILFGGSYGGMLAAWMRLKYPHVAVGALASSAPILQFEDIVPPETFYDLVSNAFKRESFTCFNYIKQSWNEMASAGQTNNGLELLTKTFNLCQKLNRTKDLYDWVEAAYSYLAMVNYPYPAEFMMTLPEHPIREVRTSILERIYEGVNVYYNYTGEAKCFELDDDPHGMSGWDWQACTEMIMPMSSSQKSSMFLPYEYNYTSIQEECLKKFGVKPRPKWITTEFGGHDIHATLKKFGSNIIFSNGLLDPWSGGSILQNISESVVSLVTEEGKAFDYFEFVRILL
ncbi:Lysosomal Pro-X carboxypeptidase [Glycine soja]